MQNQPEFASKFSFDTRKKKFFAKSLNFYTDKLKFLRKILNFGALFYVKNGVFSKSAFFVLLICILRKLLYQFLYPFLDRYFYDIAMRYGEDI